MVERTDRPRRSALVLLVPEADALVGRFRLAHDPSARAGMGAHVTLLFPFVPADRIDDTVLLRLRRHFRSRSGSAGAAGGPVELRFVRPARFPGVSYLALAEPEVVAAMVVALAAAWPDHPPYEGRFADVVPHLTVAYGDDPLLDRIEEEIAPSLPFFVRAAVATLVVEDEAGRWCGRASFALGAGIG